MYILLYDYIIIYIYYICTKDTTKKLQKYSIVRLSHPRSGDSQGQKRFLAPSADMQTRKQV